MLESWRLTVTVRVEIGRGGGQGGFVNRPGLLGAAAKMMQPEDGGRQGLPEWRQRGVGSSRFVDC